METQMSPHSRFTRFERLVPVAAGCVLLALTGFSAVGASRPDSATAPPDPQTMSELERFTNALREVGSKLRAVELGVKRAAQPSEELRAGLYRARLELARLETTLARQARALAAADANELDLTLANLNEKLASLNVELAQAEADLHQRLRTSKSFDERKWVQACGIIEKLRTTEKKLAAQRAEALQSAIEALHDLGIGVRKAQAAPPGNQELPEFPWPPPRVSAWEIIPRDFFRLPSEARCLRDIDARLRCALNACGYSDLSCFAVPEGFALVTRVEQVNEDGTAKGGSERFTTEPPSSFKISFSTYLRALFLARPGYYRIIVFVVTTCPISQSDKKISSDDANAWFSRGSDALPFAVASLAWTDNHKCTALIYEFEQPNPGVLAQSRVPGRHQCREHLTAAGLWKLLEARP